MAIHFHLKLNEHIPGGLHRLFDEELGFIKELLHSNESKVLIVHNVRKSFKRIRSLLRLLRFNFQEDWFSENNSFFRELAQELSDIRDAHVLLETLENLHQDPSVKVSLFNTETIFRMILVEIQNHEKALSDEYVSVKILDELENETLMTDWPDLKNSPIILLDGVEKIYDDGYSSMHQAYVNPTTENFHEWRKHAKHLYHIRQVLDVVWPVTANSSISELKELSETLGLDHDLANLREYVTSLENESIIEKEMLNRFITDIQSKRQKLQRLAQHIGQNIYAETAEYFIKHFENNWNKKTLSI